MLKFNEVEELAVGTNLIFNHSDGHNLICELIGCSDGVATIYCDSLFGSYYDFNFEKPEGCSLTLCIGG